MSAVKYKVKKLWKGYASVRDYIIERCIKENRELVLVYDRGLKQEKMTLDVADLKRAWQCHGTMFQSKINGKEYKLFDFKWIDDKSFVEQTSMEDRW